MDTLPRNMLTPELTICIVGKRERKHKCLVSRTQKRNYDNAGFKLYLKIMTNIISYILHHSILQLTRAIKVHNIKTRIHSN